MHIIESIDYYHNIHNSGVNVYLISASVQGVSHAHSSLSWLAKATCVYMGDCLRWPVQWTACLLYTAFLEISPHLKIPPPSKCRHMFLQTHSNKHRPRNLAAW